MGVAVPQSSSIIPPQTPAPSLPVGWAPDGRAGPAQSCLPFQCLLLNTRWGQPCQRSSQVCAAACCGVVTWGHSTTHNCPPITYDGWAGSCASRPTLNCIGGWRDRKRQACDCNPWRLERQRPSSRPPAPPMQLSPAKGHLVPRV